MAKYVGSSPIGGGVVKETSAGGKKYLLGGGGVLLEQAAAAGGGSGLLIFDSHSAVFNATRKSPQWGPLGAVQGGVRWNADRLKIPAPANLCLAWEGAGPPWDIMTSTPGQYAAASADVWVGSSVGPGTYHSGVGGDGYHGYMPNSRITPGVGSIFSVFRKSVYEAFTYRFAYGAGDYDQDNRRIGCRDQSSAHAVAAKLGDSIVLFSGVTFPLLSIGAVTVTHNIGGGCIAYCGGNSEAGVWTGTWNTDTELGFGGYWLTTASSTLYGVFLGDVFVGGLWAEELSDNEAHTLNEQWAELSRQPSIPLWFDLAAGITYNLAGTVTGITSLSGNPIEKDTLDTILNSVLTINSTLAEEVTVSANISSNFTAVANLVIEKTLIGDLIVTATNTGNIISISKLDSTLSAIASLTGIAKEQDAIDSSLIGTTSLIGIANEQDAIDSSLIGTASLLGNIGEQVSLSANLIGTMVLVGNLLQSSSTDLSGNLSISTLLDANILESVNLAASISSISALTGNIIESISLEAILSNTALLVGDIGEGLGLSGNIASSITFVGDSTVLEGIVSNLNIISSLTGDLTEVITSTALSGDISAVTSLQGELTEAATMVGDLVGTLTLTGEFLEVFVTITDTGAILFKMAPRESEFKMPARGVIFYGSN